MFYRLGMSAGIGALSLWAILSNANAAMTAADCEARYAKLDTNNTGYLTDTDGAQYFAYYRLGNKTLTDNRLPKDRFLSDCASGFYDSAAVDPGAPLKGANSFTENQAKDRILSQGGSSVTTLVKDGDGIWRGTASKDGGSQQVAVDFKGNVVFTK